MQLVSYPQADLPKTLYWQIISYMRTEWHYAFQGRLKGRRWIGSDEFNPVNMVLLDDGFVVAHAEIEYRELLHDGKIYHTYGLSQIFVYHDYRGEGYGRKIVDTATNYIYEQANAEIGMLWCNHNLRDFYLKCGWIAMDSTETWLGDTRDEAQHDPDQLLFMKFFDDTVNQSKFKNQQVYFGWTTW